MAAQRRGTKGRGPPGRYVEEPADPEVGPVVRFVPQRLVPYEAPRADTAQLLLAGAIVAYEERLSLVEGDRATDGDGAEVVISATLWVAMVDLARKVLA